MERGDTPGNPKHVYCWDGYSASKVLDLNSHFSYFCSLYALYVFTRYLYFTCTALYYTYTSTIRILFCIYTAPTSPQRPISVFSGK